MRMGESDISVEDLARLSDNEIRALYDTYIPEQLQPGYYNSRGFTLTQRFQAIENAIETMEVFDDDVWVTSFPKSGTTWLSELVWTLCNDMDSSEAQKPLEYRVRFLEYSSLYQFDDKAMDHVNNSLKFVADAPRPRFIKTHLPWTLLPAEIRNGLRHPRIIHIARNPKDVAVSYWHHNKLFRGYAGPPELFFEVFLRGLIRFSPYMDNVHSYRCKRNEPNVLLLSFEEMKSNLSEIITRIGHFLGRSITDLKKSQLIEHLQFANMKRNENLQVDHVVQYISDNYLQNNDPRGEKLGFLRKGECGSYRTEMNAVYRAKFDAWLYYSIIDHSTNS